MINHGLSHGIAALVCAQSSELLSQTLQAQWPSYYDRIHQTASSVVEQLPWSLSPELSIDLLLILTLGFVWGVAFKVLNQ
ncbi:MAG: hypothetical protein ABW139_06585 [Candidatus Thiodiazotropha sp. DIVDIV]